MKLSKIYANDKKFDPIKFNEGFNVIFGDIEKDVLEGDNKVREHNLGKTALVHLINFLLLKQETKETFFGKYKHCFMGRVFFLELKLNNNTYITIRRSVDELNKISFKSHLESDQNMVLEEEWDYKNLSLNTKNKEQSPKFILERYLAFNVAPDFGFRSFLSYGLRTQNDYQDAFRLNKFRGKDTLWKPFLFTLFGFSSELMAEKYLLDSKLTLEEGELKKIKVVNSGDSESYKIRAVIDTKQREKSDIEEQINSFDFEEQELKINHDLVNDVEVQVARVNKEVYRLNHRVEQITKILESSSPLDISLSQVKEVFEEVQLFFPNELIKQYEDLIVFTNEVTKEREMYLKHELKKVLEERSYNQSLLSELNSKRKSMLGYLGEEDSFKKYKNYQSALLKLENEILSYQSKLLSLDTVAQYEKNIESTTKTLKEVSDGLRNMVDIGNSDYQNIKSSFERIYKTIFEYTATIAIVPNSKGNIEFDAFVLGETNDLTGKGDGYTSIRVLCMSFVLSVLVNYSSQSFYRFAYHDGILDSWGGNHKIAFIELMRDLCPANNIQYIVSLIKSDVPLGFSFEKNEIACTLSKDKELFGFVF